MRTITIPIRAAKKKSSIKLVWRMLVKSGKDTIGDYTASISEQGTEDKPIYVAGIGSNKILHNIKHRKFSNENKAVAWLNKNKVKMVRSKKVKGR